jgi:hypothetical protein
MTEKLGWWTHDGRQRHLKHPDSDAALCGREEREWRPADDDLVVCEVCGSKEPSTPNPRF